VRHGRRIRRLFLWRPPGWRGAGQAQEDGAIRLACPRLGMSRTWGKTRCPSPVEHAQQVQGHHHGLLLELSLPRQCNLVSYMCGLSLHGAQAILRLRLSMAARALSCLHQRPRRRHRRLGGHQAHRTPRPPSASSTLDVQGQDSRIRGIHDAEDTHATADGSASDGGPVSVSFLAQSGV
jgi:hypothetical protein